MPDDHRPLAHVSLRLPADLIEAFDRLAEALDRPRSWVMLRALRWYLDEEGAEIFEDGESLAELDRGERVSTEEMRQRLEAIIAKAEKVHTRQK